jgi:hypothetical protein
MNDQVRRFLIEVARKKDKTVFYSEMLKQNGLHFELDTPEGKSKLKALLTEISEFENLNKRPMLTSLAINKETSDPGPGFFDLAEKFGKGNAKNLQKNFWAIKEAERTRTYWQNNKNYSDHLADSAQTEGNDKSIQKLFKELVFDNKSDVQEWIDEWHNGYCFFVSQVLILRKQINTNKQWLLNDNRLYSNLDQSLQDYNSFMIRWLKEKSNGISSRGQSVLSQNDFDIIINDGTFQRLAHLLIMKPSLERYNDFHQWWIGNNLIKNRPLLINRAAAACNPVELSSTVDNQKFWTAVDYFVNHYGFSFSSEVNRNWYAANEQITVWLDVRLRTILEQKTPDKVQQLCWRNIFVWRIYQLATKDNDLKDNELQITGQPKEGYNEIPKRKKAFEGTDKDFEAEAKADKELGDAGEALVKQFEIKKLNDLKRFDDANAVSIVKNGKGYDIASFDKYGTPIFIEVKTTADKASTPFYLSENELAFMQKNKENYFIYRVYNYDEEKNAGRCFIIENDIESKIFKEPVSFRIYLKKNK